MSNRWLRARSPLVHACCILAASAVSAHATSALVANACNTDNGMALSAPPTCLCSVGTPSALHGNGLWTWTCSGGGGGGVTAHCRAREVAQYRFTTADDSGASASMIFSPDGEGTAGGDDPIDAGPPPAIVRPHGAFESLDPEGLFGETLRVVGGRHDWGAIVGGSADITTARHGFLIQWDHVIDVEFAHSTANGIKPFGTIIGAYRDADGADHGVIRRYGHDTHPGAGESQTSPTRINANDAIVACFDVDAAAQPAAQRERPPHDDHRAHRAA